MCNHQIKLDLRDRIKNLLPLQQNEIFNIILKNDITYSCNNNGIFINITKIDIKLITEINKYINYIEKNEERLETIENECVDIFKNKSCNIENIYKIINFKEFENLNNIDKLEEIKNKMNIKKKKEYHLKFINTMKKYQRLITINNDNDNNINELIKKEYLIKI